MKAASFQKGRAWIELDMENLRHNVGLLQSLLPEKCELMPSVKANAHGHGAVEICHELNNVGVRAFCVASVMEGVELRKRHIKGVILVFGYTHPEYFPLLGRYRLTQTVVDFEYAANLNAFGRKIAVHIKIDTGMNRLGEPSRNTGDILRIFSCENLVVTGAYSHFCTQNSGDPAHRAFTQTQLEKFYNVLAVIKESGFKIPKTHLQGSYGVFSRTDLDCDFARPGMALYGVYRNNDGALADGRTASSDGLRPVLSVKARVCVVKTIHAGETVGYEFGFVAARETKVAVLSIGYADGLPRALSCGAGHVLIGGAAAPIVGNICMDQCFADVTEAGEVRRGDVAVIIGRDGDAEITAYDMAEKANTIPNEIVGRLGSRLARCSA